MAKELFLLLSGLAIWQLLSTYVKREIECDLVVSKKEKVAPQLT